MGGARKHEIYAAAFGGHLFYDLYLQSRGGLTPLPPLDPLLRDSPLNYQHGPVRNFFSGVPGS